MKCFYHPDRDAIATCPKCRQPVCQECHGIREFEVQCASCFSAKRGIKKATGRVQKERETRLASTKDRDRRGATATIPLGRVMKTTAVERLKWLEAFIPLYEKVTPLVRYIANLERIDAGELPLSPDVLMGSTITLKPALQALRKMAKPKEKELLTLMNDLEAALANCIKAGEAAARYVKSGSQTMEGRIQLSNLINSTVLAHEYMESASKGLKLLSGNNV